MSCERERGHLVSGVLRSSNNLLPFVRVLGQGASERCGMMDGRLAPILIVELLLGGDLVKKSGRP